MDKRAFGYLLVGAAVGYGVGYAVCWWRRPLPQLVSKETGEPITKKSAQVLLDTGAAIQKIKPTLTPLAKGEIPSPKDIYDIVRGF